MSEGKLAHSEPLVNTCIIAIQLGKLMVDIATGAVPDAVDDGKDSAAAAMGRKGGACRAASMTPERRAEIAKAAAGKRWEK